jgi:hypothetical protein
MNWISTNKFKCSRQLILGLVLVLACIASFAGGWYGGQASRTVCDMDSASFVRLLNTENVVQYPIVVCKPFYSGQK